MTLVTFDIDGTLMFCGHRGSAHRDAFSGAMKDILGIEEDLSTYLGVSFAGVSDYWIIQQILEKSGNSGKSDLGDKLLHSAEEHFVCEFDGELDLLPGVKTAINELIKHGIDVGVCSGNLPKIGITKLKAAGLTELVQSKALGFGTFLNRADILKDAIRKGGKQYTKVIHVGDAPQDVQAALDIGALPFAVETGRFKHRELFGESCTVVENLEIGLQELIRLAVE